jgi:hypothetical protein
MRLAVTVVSCKDGCAKAHEAASASDKAAARGETKSNFMMDRNVQCPDRLPRQYSGRHGHAYFLKAHGHRVGRYPGWRNASIAFPGALFQAAPSGIDDGAEFLD